MTRNKTQVTDLFNNKNNDNKNDDRRVYIQSIYIKFFSQFIKLLNNVD